MQFVAYSEANLTSLLTEGLSVFFSCAMVYTPLSLIFFCINRNCVCVMSAPLLLHVSRTDEGKEAFSQFEYRYSVNSQTSNQSVNQSAYLCKHPTGVYEYLLF